MQDGEESWSPENEKDPIKAQAEMLKAYKEFLESKSGSDESPRRPFEELSGLLKRAWEETKRIAPDAPPAVQANMVAFLMEAADEE